MLKPAEISDGMKPIKLISTEDTRFFHCNIKTLNLIPSVRQLRRLRKPERMKQYSTDRAEGLQNVPTATAIL